MLQPIHVSLLLKTLLSACLIAGMSSCSKLSSSATSSDKGKGGRGKRAAGPTTVQTSPVIKKLIAQTADATVSLVGRKQTNVFSKVAGRVTRILVPEGEAVKAGQTLFQVDRSEPGESYLSVPVTSPISGWIGRWNVTEGTQVSSQDAVALVVDDQSLIANIFLPVQEWVQVKLDSKVSIQVQDLVRPAKILTIARAAEAGSGRGALTVSVENADHAFKSGVVALASIELKKKKRLLIPAAALRISEKGAAVFRVNGDKAEKRNVKYEIFSNDTIEVTEGVDENDIVVTVGAHLLFDGAEIKTASDNKATPSTHEVSSDGNQRKRTGKPESGEGPRQ